MMKVPVTGMKCGNSGKNCGKSGNQAFVGQVESESPSHRACSATFLSPSLHDAANPRLFHAVRRERRMIVLISQFSTVSVLRKSAFFPIFSSHSTLRTHRGEHHLCSHPIGR